MNGLKISDKYEDMKLDVIHEFISHSYWAKGIPLKTLKRALKNSLCFGVFTEANSQVAFARMVTDYATYAYLADVFVVEEYRNKGVARWLIGEILEHHQLQGLRRISLATKDAHGLYKQFGVKELANPGIFMELMDPDVYNRTY